MVEINSNLITDDMMYEGGVKPRSSALVDQIRENQLWHDIRRAAKTNNSLQAALDHAIMIYKLSKEYKDAI
jgi:hypothetical protein